MCTADASAAHRPFSPIFPVVDFRGERGCGPETKAGSGGLDVPVHNMTQC